MNNMFINVSSNGNIYDRTRRKNIRLVMGTPYRTWFGFVKFFDDNGNKFVERYDHDGKFCYRNELSTGSYFVTPLRAEKAEKQSDEYKRLLNRLISLVKKPTFRLIEEDNLEKNYQIRLYLDIKPGDIKGRFNIRVKKGEYGTYIEEIQSLLDRASHVNLKLLVMNYCLENQDAAMFTIDEDFIETANDIEAYYIELQKAE